MSTVRYSVNKDKDYKTHMACDLNVIVKNEQVLKITGNHFYFKSGSI